MRIVVITTSTRGLDETKAAWRGVIFFLKFLFSVANIIIMCGTLFMHF